MNPVRQPKTRRVTGVWRGYFYAVIFPTKPRRGDRIIARKKPSQSKTRKGGRMLIFHRILQPFLHFVTTGVLGINFYVKCIELALKPCVEIVELFFFQRSGGNAVVIVLHVFTVRFGPGDNLYNTQSLFSGLIGEFDWL